ncbi:MAG: AAA family ATPase [Victivallales bacterium]|nr:AAA family ATPase [Victivallales bacterium]
MKKLQPILTDSSDFPEIREGGCVYVDKTAYFHDLITRQDARRFFLSRPRRFGKSLMISTLKAIFLGRKELFDGLAISKTNWTWEKYPVIHFNFINAATSDIDEFKPLLLVEARKGITEAGGSYDLQYPPAANFGQAIDELSAKNDGKGIVILIDEYDAPVARLLDKPDDAEKVRGILADFYSQMKDRTGKIRFLMVTGVSKFTKMSVFSALSNPTDLSMKDAYATMLGYTETELEQYFGNHMRAHAKMMKKPYDEYREELKFWFNGYRLGKGVVETVYNPVSIGVNLASPEVTFQSCWSSTGKASMLMNYLKRKDFLSIDMDGVKKVRERDFDVTDLRNLKTVPMLYQAGYLTIDNYDSNTGMFTLRVPDEEVRQDLATLMTAVAAEQDTTWVSEIGAYLLDGEWVEFFTGLKSLYASLPYGAKEKSVHEFSFERNLLILLWSQGMRCTAEDRQSNGQADIVAVHPCGVFIFELKVDESAEEALEQVKKKGYDEPYRSRNLPIWLIGLNFSRKTRRLKDAKVEKL